MKGGVYGGPGFAVSVCDGSVCAVFSAERRVSYGALLLADTPAGEISFSRDKAVVADGGYTVCELSCEYIDDYSAFVLSASAVAPAEYRIAPAPGALLSAPVGERTRGTDFTVKWLASGKRSLCIAVCGAAEPDGDRIIFTGGNGYVLLCEGDDLNEITSRVSQVVSLYEQGYFGRRSFPARREKSDGSAAARILSVLRSPDGLVLRDAFDMRSDAFTQYLCVRAYCAQESCDRAADLLTACVSRFETGSPVWNIDGEGPCSLNGGALSAPLIALAACAVPPKRFPQELYAPIVNALSASAAYLRRDMMPFEGYECFAARLFPEYGSALSTAAFIAAVNALESRREHIPVSIPDGLILAARRARDGFAANFLRDGRPVEYSAARAKGVKRKRYRFGYCAACGAEPGSAQKWTVRVSGGAYLCLDCFFAGGVPEAPPASSASRLTPVLYSEYIGARLWRAQTVNDMLTSMLRGETEPERPHEYYMLCSAAAANPYYRRYADLAFRTAEARSGPARFTSAACAAARLTAQNSKKSNAVL